MYIFATRFTKETKTMHEPIHVHVKHSGTECIFDLILENGEL